jgi:hypothetical protein
VLLEELCEEDVFEEEQLKSLVDILEIDAREIVEV